MKRPPNSKHRAHGAKERKKSREPSKPAGRQPEPRSYSHRIFGAIPMIPVTRIDAKGAAHVGYDFDPDYAPPLPKGAIRGDVRKQEFCRMCHAPKYFYVDVPRRCVQCGKDFVFRAAEQKLWYETLKFHFDSVATRCLACRRQRRSEQAVVRQLADATATAREHPDDVAAQLGLAEAIVRYAQRRNEGPLDDAIAASRRARRLSKGHAKSESGEAFFWEAMAHALAGRRKKARELFAQFLDAGAVGRQQAQFAKEARAWLEET